MNSERDIVISKLETELLLLSQKSDTIRINVEKMKKERRIEEGLKLHHEMIDKEICFICLIPFSENAGQCGFSTVTYMCDCTKPQTIHTSCWFESKAYNRRMSRQHKCAICSGKCEFNFAVSVEVTQKLSDLHEASENLQTSTDNLRYFNRSHSFSSSISEE